MAESQEGTSISVNPKEKKSLLVEEIGKDFLSSWKSMSVTEDDAMDFSFNTVSNGKEKFKFDKLDVDFNLEGNLDKLSSFKVDMPDLDFSCSSKNIAKTKESTEEDTSSGNHQGKKDLFSFSFDFNDEDFTNDVQIGSKLMGNTKSLTKELTDDELFSLRSDKNVNSPRNVRDGFNSDDEHNGSKLFEESSSEDKQVKQGDPAMLVEKNSDRMSFYASDAQISSKLVEYSGSRTTELSEGEPILLRSANNFNNLCDDREYIESDDAQSESKVSAEAKLQDNQVAQGEPFMRENQKDTGEDFTSNEAQISNKLVGSKSLSGELRKNWSASLESAKDAKTLGNISWEGINVDGVRNGSKVFGNSKPQEKEATTDEPPTLRSEKNSLFQVNLSSPTEKTNKSTTEASGGPKFVISSLQSIWNVKSDSVEGTKTVKRTPDLSISTEETSKSTAEASQNPKFVVSSMQAIRNVKNDSIEGSKSGKGIPDLSGGTEKTNKYSTEASVSPKFVVSSMQPIQNVKKDSIDRIETGKRTPDLSSSTEKASTSSTVASGNPKPVVSSMQSFQKVKNISFEGIKTVNRTPDLSSLKTLRIIGRNKEVPNSTVLGQGSSFGNSEQNMKLLANMTNNIALPTNGTEKQKPLTTVSLKRKKIEESNAELGSLKSLKCLSELPKESRYFKESSGRVNEEKACNHENQTQSRNNNVLHDNSTSGLEVSREINMSELEISVRMENDGIVERAETYTKELEDISNMLKKKHEEAKELLVRAIVNNNNLLMLNHPMHEEKIRMVQKFATQLTFREVAN